MKQLWFVQSKNVTRRALTAYGHSTAVAAYATLADLHDQFEEELIIRERDDAQKRRVSSEYQSPGFVNCTVEDHPSEGTASDDGEDLRYHAPLFIVAHEIELAFIPEYENIPTFVASGGADGER